MLPDSSASDVQSAYVLTNSQPTPIPVEVRTLSADEALVVAAQPLDGRRMVLKLSLAQKGVRFLDCDVALHSEYQRLVLGHDQGMYVACRLRFRRAFSIAEIHPSLLDAFAQAEQPSSETRHRDPNAPQTSLVPFLSAIGLVVVYASQQPWTQILSVASGRPTVASATRVWREVRGEMRTPNAPKHSRSIS